MITKLDFSEETKRIWQEIYSKNQIKAPFFEYEWHKNWFEILGRNYEALILNIDDKIIASFSKKGSEVVFSGGYEVADYLDLVGGEKFKIQAWEEVIKYLKNNGVTKIFLNNIPQNSKTLDFFHSQKAVSVKEDTTPKFILPKSFEEYLISLPHKYRHELRRKIRKFEREHLNGVIEKSEELKKDIEEVFLLMKTNPVKIEFLTAEMENFFRAIVQAFSDQTEILFMRIGEEKAAAVIYFKTSDSYLLYNSGYKRVEHSNAGFYLKAMTIKRAIEEGKKEYNFLQGSERYKHELGGQDFFVYKVELNI